MGGARLRAAAGLEHGAAGTAGGVQGASGIGQRRRRATERLVEEQVKRHCRRDDRVPVRARSARGRIGAHALLPSPKRRLCKEVRQLLGERLFFRLRLGRALALRCTGDGSVFRAPLLATAFIFGGLILLFCAALGFLCHIFEPIDSGLQKIRGGLRCRLVGRRALQGQRCWTRRGAARRGRHHLAALLDVSDKQPRRRRKPR